MAHPTAAVTAPAQRHRGRGRLWLAPLALAALGLAGCGSGSPAPAASAAGAKVVVVPRPSCQPPAVVKVSQSDAGIAFTPNQVTLQMGQFVTFTNSTKATNTLTATPDAGLGSAGIDPGESQQIQFNLAGAYTLGSKESKGPTMKVTVQETVGLTCGHVGAAADLNLTKKGFDQPAVSLKAGQGINIINESGDDVQIACTPDPGIPKGDLQLAEDENQTVVFRKAGTYACTADKVPGAKVTLTVR